MPAGVAPGTAHVRSSDPRFETAAHPPDDGPAHEEGLPPPAFAFEDYGASTTVAVGRWALETRAVVPVRTDGCQELLVLGLTGRFELLDEASARTVIRSGDAVRVAHGAARRASLVAAEGGDVLVVVSRPAEAPFAGRVSVGGPLAAPPGCPRGPGEPSVVRVVREDVDMLPQGDGSLEVAVLLDGPRHGARWAGLSILRGRATVAVPEHQHPDSDELLYFARTRGTLRIDGAAQPVGSGEFVAIRRGSLHAFDPSGDTELLAYQLYAPSGPEQRFLRRPE